MNQRKEVSFLFNSGSDLSLICSDKVDKEFLNKLQQHGVKPRSVQGTPLTYHGFLEFNVCIGNKTVRNQRFHIVDDIVCPFVAGIDLISSLSPMYIEWEAGAVYLQQEGTFQLSHQYELPRSLVKPSTHNGSEPVLAHVSKNTTIPAFSEATVRVKARFTGEGSFEPQLAARHDYLGAARGVFSTRDGYFVVRVTNTDPSPVTLYRDETVGRVSSTFSTLHKDGHSSVKPDNPRLSRLNKTLNIDSWLSSHKQQDIRSLVAEFNEIFWLPGDPLGFSDIVTHSIPTGDSPPVATRPRRYSPQECAEIDKEVKRLIDIGVVAATRHGLHRFCLFSNMVKRECVLIIDVLMH